MRMSQRFPSTYDHSYLFLTFSLKGLIFCMKSSTLTDIDLRTELKKIRLADEYFFRRKILSDVNFVQCVSTKLRQKLGKIGEILDW